MVNAHEFKNMESILIFFTAFLPKTLYFMNKFEPYRRQIFQWHTIVFKILILPEIEIKTVCRKRPQRTTYVMHMSDDTTYI